MHFYSWLSLVGIWNGFSDVIKDVGTLGTSENHRNAVKHGIIKVGMLLLGHCD